MVYERYFRRGDSFGRYANNLEGLSGKYGRNAPLYSGRYRSSRRYYKNWASDSTGYWVNRSSGSSLYKLRNSRYWRFEGYDGVRSYSDTGSFRYLADKYNF